MEKKGLKLGPVAYSPDGKTNVTADPGGSFHNIRDELPKEPDALRAWLKAETEKVPPAPKKTATPSPEGETPGHRRQSLSSLARLRAP
jgi:hypothetical protein